MRRRQKPEPEADAVEVVTVEEEDFETYKPSLSNFFLKALWYGPPGGGKTTLMGTAQLCEAMSPCLFVNLEGGVLSLIDMLNPPDIYDVRGDISRFEAAYRHLKYEDHGYKSVCLDSLSELQRLHRETLVGHRAQAGKREDMFDVVQKDWGDNMNYILFWMRRFRDLPMHVMAACHSENKPKPDGGERVHPLLNKALVEPMCGIFDVVGYLTAVAQDGEEEHEGEKSAPRKLLCEPRTIGDIEFVAKDRSPGGRIGRVVKNPTMPIIWRRLTRPIAVEHKTAPNPEKDITTARRRTRPVVAAGEP